MKFRNILFIILFFILSFVVYINVIKTEQDKSKTVVFWTLQLGAYDKYINNIISEYETINPEVKIKWIDVPYSEGEKRTLASILTDNPPDLVNLTPDFSLLLAQKNALYTFDEEKLNQFLPSLIKTLKYNGKYFGIPFYATSAVTLYNSALTDKKPETYDELFQLSADNGTYLTMINFAENDTLLKILNKYNINSPKTINSEKSIQLFSEFKRLYDKNFVPKESITQTHRDALEKYMSGQLEYLVTGANFINMIKENAPSVYKNTKILPQLMGDTGLYDYSLMNFIIPVKSKNPEKDALKDAYFQNAENNDLSAHARIISSRQLNNLQPPLTCIKNKKELNTISANHIQDILINNAPIKITLDKFSIEWQKL